MKKKQSMPDNGVYARIGRSRRHGVGVLAVREITQGINIFPDDDVELVWLTKRAIKPDKLPPGIRKLYEDFCIIEDKGNVYGCPKSFNLLTASLGLREKSDTGKERQ